MDQAHVELLRKAECYAEAYLAAAEDRPVFPEPGDLADLSALNEPMPQHPTDPGAVLKLLHTLGAKATVTTTGGRYYGFVNGGVLPIAHAADWLTSTWDQNAALYVMSPLASKLEEVCETWLAALLGLPEGTAAGFVSGSSNAILCALAAARNALLRRQGYDVVENGLRGAPKLRVVVGAQAHASVWKALSILGIGSKEVEVAQVDDWGRIRPEALPPLDASTLLIVQAGGVNGGAFDPIDVLCDRASQAGAWVHVDGAFGLWAAASRKHAHLVRGLCRADSWSTDAHKTLNVGYDSGIVLCKDRDALVRALQRGGDYILFGENRDGMLYTTEMSRRARAIALWAAMKQLGAEGIEALVDALCAHAEDFAAKLAERGFRIVPPTCLNQIMIQCDSPELTRRTLRALQAGGVCWCGGSTWNGEPVIRVSVCSHRTTTTDIDRSVAAFVGAREAARKDNPV